MSLHPTLEGLEDHFWIPPLGRYRLHPFSVWLGFSCQIFLPFRMCGSQGLNKINTSNPIPYSATWAPSLREEVEKDYNNTLRCCDPLAKTVLLERPNSLYGKLVGSPNKQIKHLYHKNITTF